MSVHIGQQSTDPLHRENAFKCIDQQEPADLVHIVTLVLGWGQETSLDPVLHCVGLQAGDVGDLAQHHPSGEEHGLKQFADPNRVGTLDG